MKKIVKIIWLLWLLIGVTGFIIGLTLLLTASHSAVEVNCSGAFAIWGIAGIIGSILLIRNHWMGAIIWISTSAILTAILIIYAGPKGMWIGRLAILVCISGCIPALALFLPSGSGGPVIRIMSEGFGWHRSRHIFQLTIAVIAAVCGLTAIRSVSVFHSSGNDKNEIEKLKSKTDDKTDDNDLKVKPDKTTMTAETVISMINAPDATLQSLNDASRGLYLLADSLNVLYSDRIAAVSDLLRRGITTNSHDPKKLANVMMYHSGTLSDTQQAIIDWYLSLDAANRNLWIEVGPVNSLAEMRIVLERHINAPVYRDTITNKN